MKKIQVMLYFASVVLAVGIGVQQYSGSENVGERLGNANNCDFSGYIDSICSSSIIDEASGCTSGTYKTPEGPGGGKGDFKYETLLGWPKATRRGDCGVAGVVWTKKGVE